MTMISRATPAAEDERLRHTVGFTGTPAIGEAEEKPRMVRLTVALPSDLVEQMRDAVYWTPGLTLAWLIGRAVRTSLAELVQSHRGPFPRLSKPLRAGRPRLVGQSMKVLSQPINGGGGGAGEHALRTRVLSEPSMG
jgi:hypothetical protein